MMKILHACLLIGSLVFASIGLAAIIRSKTVGKRSHFMTYHSWLGIVTIGLFVSQWVCGFLCFLVPKCNLDVRQAYMPR
jgi:multisubunit Na+/H+ antiporter MnhG subunit